MLVVLVVGLLMNLVALPVAARRVVFLYKMITAGQPDPERVELVKKRTGPALRSQLVEVFGQKKLLKWSLPGAAHFFVMWAFFILATVYLEAYGSLLKLLFHGGDAKLDWAIPFVGHWAVLGFLQDFIAVMAFVGILVFVGIRVRNAPKELGRRSRFFGSHLSGAWITLFMIFNVIWTLFLFRGASAALGNLPYKHGAFASIGIGKLLDSMGHTPLEVVEGIGLLLHIGVMLAFLIFVLNSKHLHIFIAPINVLFKRQPVALGALTPMLADGKRVDLEDLEDLDDETVLGVGKVEDFTWKGLLDLATCTECGRCQSQCPAWNTEKPLSPKLLIMGLRDHAMAKAPYFMAADDAAREKLPASVLAEAERPLVGATEGEWAWEPTGGAVIDDDVLWSCTSCGACVNQCPVDIEHVDHIVDMRRYQILVESNFPAELNGLFKGLEGKGNPWNMSATARMDWAKDLPFDVKVVGEDIESLDEVEWLFWVGCAGAYEDRAKKTTRAVAELLDMAGVSFGVLGNGETCTGDPARRAGNEFVFQGLAAQNVEVLQESKAKKVVSTCAHCFNTLKNEYAELGVELEVVHHTQLLNRLVREKKLTPVAASGGSRSITYHDPCYLGRHNQVYNPPRELLQVIPDATFTEMPRHGERSFCCGAGGARMWMEENIGERINVNRTKEAVETGADQIAVGCPFCRVMLSDGLTQQQSAGEAREEVEVLDVAQLLLASIKGEAPKKASAGSSSGGTGGGTAVATKDEPEAKDATQTEDTVTATEDVGPLAKASGGSSLFDVEESDDAGSTASAESAEPSESAEPEPAAQGKGADDSFGGSLFDVGDDQPADQPADEPAAKAETKPAPESVDEPEEQGQGADDAFSGSLFDIGDDQPADEPAAKAETKPEVEPEVESEPDLEAERDTKPEAETEPEPPAARSSSSEPANVIPEGGSLFDIEEPAEPSQPEPAAEPEPEPEPESQPEPEPAAAATEQAPAPSEPSNVIPEGGSLFDIAAPEEPAEAAPKPAAEENPAPTKARAAAASDRIPEGQSLFDIAAPGVAEAAGEAAPEPVTEPEAEAEAEAEAEPEAKTEPASDPEEASAPTSLRDIKAKAAAGDADAAEADEAPAEETATTEEPVEPEEPAAEQKSKPAATSSGETHTPKTDADIGGADSLFDL
ncbi:4Fe-4S dicluster domain-containing protein [Nocardioides mangrovicus]|uniref:4Fe-4S dicluster domain-containing protein n=1 Tax=Nocardioides mangrovicus TaxID=2478913 RepID=A0A3L8NXB4_9ACTN|nr:heterodisulfide reductase-related iron-sulfur binding cluster [Nocardioides mangrovicus]RLV47896.1 4Fe-4S dicluster domain-containing protein [Nocardioides mangrovicus]